MAVAARRPRVEGPIGWIKEFGLLRRPKLRGVRKAGSPSQFSVVIRVRPLQSANSV